MSQQVPRTTIGTTAGGSGPAFQIGGGENPLTYVGPPAIGFLIGGRLAGLPGAVLGAGAGFYFMRNYVKSLFAG